MRYVPIKRVVPGMVLGRSIYDGDGRMLVAKQMLLTEEYITSLYELGFPGVYIDDEFTQEIEIDEIVSPEIRREAVKEIRNLFLEQNEGEDFYKEEQSIKRIVTKVVEDILSSGDVMCNMMDLKDYDDYTFFHSVNVSVLSAIMGAGYGMSKEELIMLTEGAMLHDIGKRFLPIEMLNAPRRLKEEEMKQLAEHPRLGFEFLKKNYNFPMRVCLSVLEHHEWYNGEGYPLGRAGDEIPIQAKIVKVADVYDAMISKRPYHEPLAPSEVVEYIMARSGMEFDPEVVTLFLKWIAVYPTGCEVLLSNQKRAVVVENYKDFVLRPKVKLIESGEIINLKEDENARNITIIKLMI